MTLRAVVRRLLLGCAVAVVLLVALVALALVMVGGPSTPEAGRWTEDAPYGARGDHTVGFRGITIEGDAPLDVAVWYPTSDPGTRGSTVSYDYEIEAFAPIGAFALGAYDGHALPDAPLDRSNGPFPLVVLSPGFAFGASTYAWLAEHLASYGFVVMAPTHHEQLDPSTLWRSTIHRPRDVRAVLDWIDAQTQAVGSIGGRIDTGRVAVIGHSYGGYTALAAAGARLDTGGFRGECRAAAGSGRPLAFLCDALLPHWGEMASSVGLDTTPAGLWPTSADDRIDAVVSMAGDAAMFGRSGLAEVRVPVLAMGGTADDDSPFAWGPKLTYDAVSSERKVEIAFADAEHMIFTGPCERIRLALKFVPNDFCSDASWDRGHAHALIRHFTTAFLLAELSGDAAAAAALDPDGVDLPKVAYRVSGYGVDRGREDP